MFIFDCTHIVDLQGLLLERGTMNWISPSPPTCLSVRPQFSLPAMLVLGLVGYVLMSMRKPVAAAKIDDTKKVGTEDAAAVTPAAPETKADEIPVQVRVCTRQMSSPRPGGGGRADQRIGFSQPVQLSGSAAILAQMKKKQQAASAQPKTEPPAQPAPPPATPVPASQVQSSPFPHEPALRNLPPLTPSRWQTRFVNQLSTPIHPCAAHR